MIVIIDNYDSFVYNLYQYAGEFTDDIKVYRNDKVTLNDLNSKDIQGIILSPGPGRPEDAGICIDVIKHFKGKVPILGICLGHQAIGYAFGGNVVGCKDIMHGKTSVIKVEKNILFHGLNEKTKVMRYHSLTVDKENMPNCLVVTAETDDGVVMAVRHKEYDIFGVQFHPESIMTENGKKIIENFVRRVCYVS